MTPSEPLFPRKRILVATDFLESSRLALDYAVAFAHHYASNLVVFHSMELTQPALELEAEGKMSLMRKSAEERLEGLVRGVRRTGVEAEWKLGLGNPSEAIPKWVDAFPVDLLVLGTHGVHRGLDHLLLGANTEKVLLTAHCPTLTIGRHVMSGVDLHLRFNEILYVSDFTEESIAAASYALALGRDFDTFVDVCQIEPKHTGDDPAQQKRLQKEFHETMQSLLPSENHRWAKDAFRLDRSRATEQIMERIHANPNALIVLGVKKTSWLGRHLSTSFAYELLSKATCPILTIHAPQ
jgi:nucleotide-binding universal stress UspA family protein